ncbi:MAG TPA: hypothetical protein VGG64_01630, partial [Pirellulales bacterium]
MDLDAFLEHVVSSRLIAAETLNASVREFMAGSRAARSRGSDLAALGDYLVSKSLVTRWQCDELMAGRCDFYFFNFKFLEKDSSGG